MSKCWCISAWIYFFLLCIKHPKQNKGVFLVFLGHLSHSGDLLLWVGVRRHASCVVRRPLTSSSQELRANLNQIWYVASVG